MELLALPAMGAAFMVGVVLALRRAEVRLGGGLVEAWFFAVVSTLIVVGGALFLFHLLVPLGRYGGDPPAYVMWAFRLFALICGATPLLGRVFGYTIERGVAGRGGAVGLAAAIGATVILLGMSPLIEFMNACSVGRPFLLNVAC